MKSRKIKLDVTEKQLTDIIFCVGKGLDRAAGYGSEPAKTQVLLEVNREKLLQKLKLILAAGSK